MGKEQCYITKKESDFVDELLPRDVVTKAIQEQMEKDHTEFVGCRWSIFRGDDTKTFPTYLSTMSGRRIRRHERVGSGCTGTALLLWVASGWILTA